MAAAPISAPAMRLISYMSRPFSGSVSSMAAFSELESAPRAPVL
jgi:hypothetical protein